MLELTSITQLSDRIFFFPVRLILSFRKWSGSSSIPELQDSGKEHRRCVLNCVLDFPETAMAFWNIPVDEHTHPGMYPLLLICTYSLVTNRDAAANKLNRSLAIRGWLNGITEHTTEPLGVTNWGKKSWWLLWGFAVCLFFSIRLPNFFLRQQRLSQLTKSTVSAQLSHPQFPPLSKLSCLFPFILTLAFINPSAWNLS